MLGAEEAAAARASEHGDRRMLEVVDDGMPASISAGMPISSTVTPRQFTTVRVGDANRISGTSVATSRLRASGGAEHRPDEAGLDDEVRD